MFDEFLKRLQDKSFTLRPEWGFEQPAQKAPLVSDDLANCLAYGTIQSIKGIKRILSDTEVELEDRKKVDVDIFI
jgi:dimethylaniline monooxygenase (N-oxide forming)